MSRLRKVGCAFACALGLAGGAQGAVLTPGTLYALAFDFGTSMETVVTVDPVTGAFTPVGPGVPDCCLVGGFPVFALDANTGGFYIAGNLFSDPGGSPQRLLGFFAVSGALVTSPFLPAGFNYNLIKLDVETGTLYALVFDFGLSQERVATIDPVTAAVTPIAGGIADCCTMGGFNVSALDPATDRFYVAGNLLSDPPGSAQRLLGFDTAAGTLATSPFLPAGVNYNDFELDPLTGTIYGLVFDFGTMQESVVTVDPATAALTPVAGGIADCCLVSSFNALDPYGDFSYIKGNLLSDPPATVPRLLGFDVAAGTLATSPFLPAGFNDNVLQAAVVFPTCDEPPVVSCNSPATITPPDAPISFTATATDDCDEATVEIVAHDCWKLTHSGKRIDKTGSCVVEIDGATITIVDSGGVGDHIGWTVTAEDGEGNSTTVDCEVVVVNPGNG
ncbi:MAG: hypothetical protein ACRD2T_05400 [Thermoanaerobaculia bacterium]